MVKITYIEDNGTEHTVDVDKDMSLMEGAIHNDVPGIDADCGGACACATCMVYIPEEWKDKLPEVKEEEELMLDFHTHAKDNSRLACQLTVSESLEGIKVKMPPSQH